MSFLKPTIPKSAALSPTAYDKRTKGAGLWGFFMSLCQSHVSAALLQGAGIKRIWYERERIEFSIQFTGTSLLIQLPLDITS